MRYDSGVRGWEASDKFRFSDLPGRVWESITNQEGPYTLLITTIMELGPQSHYGDGLLGPNSIIVVYMDPLGYCPIRNSLGQYFGFVGPHPDHHPRIP